MKAAARARIIFRTPPERAFDAFADPQLMSQFWFTRNDDGLREGKSVKWYIGDGPDSPSIEVNVKEIRRPERLHIEWGQEGEFTEVVWTFEQTESRHTLDLWRNSTEVAGEEGSR